MTVPDTHAMLARVARLLLLAWFASLAAAAVAGVAGGWGLGSRVVLCALLFVHPAFLAAEMLLARCIAARNAAPPARWPDLLRALAAEWRESTAVFAWRMPLRPLAVEDHLPAGSRGQRGVVFVHGYLCNRGLWNPWMKRLRKLDRACVAVTLEPVFAGLDDYVPQLERAVRRIEAATGLAPVIVAHSMGGLVARAWLRSRGGDTGQAARLITIGTPHRGTWLARLGDTRNARAMRVDSAWLAALAAAEPVTLPELITSWWSECDQVVYPPPNAVYPGSESRQLRGVGHLALAAREEIWKEIRWRIDY